jgi:hypothetical protein
MFTRASTKPTTAAGSASTGKNQPTAAPTSRITNETTIFTIVSS